MKYLKMNLEHQRFILAVLLCALIFFSLVSTGHAQSDAALQQKLATLETKMVSIEAQQKKIIEKQDEILKELDVLRVWVRRN